MSENETSEGDEMIADVEPHLRTEGEIRELQPRVDFMAQRMCQTQGMVLWALKEAGLTVVLLDPRAREIAPDGAEPAVSEKHVNLAYYAAAKCEHQLQGACLSCVERALAAAEERGRRKGVEEAAKIVENKDVIVVRGAQVYVGQTLKNIANEIRALVSPVGLEQAVPRDPFGILAPRDSGKE